MSKKYYTRKRFSNNKSRRHKRIHQRGGSEEHLLRFIRGLDINPIFLNRDPIVITLEPNETNDRIKVAYASAMVRYIDDNGLLTNANLRGQELAEKKRDFLNALHGLSQRYGVTNNDFNNALEDVEQDVEADDDDAIMVNVEDRQEYTVYDAADQMFVEFLKVGPIPVITSSIADRTRSKENREGIPLEEYEQVQPRKKRTNVFTLETTSRPESTITLGDKQTYNFNEIKNMWNYNKVETPKRYKYSPEDKTRIENFIKSMKRGGKMSRKKRKMRKTRKTKY